VMGLNESYSDLDFAVSEIDGEIENVWREFDYFLLNFGQFFRLFRFFDQFFGVEGVEQVLLR